MSKTPARTKPSSTDDDVFAAATPPSAAEQAPAVEVEEITDGRSLHATGRTHQFATRIKKVTHQKMRQIVKREKEAGNANFTLAELVELAVDAYERERADH